ncbi:RsiV family protein [Kushneria phosphatilytica]|nr:RsiV family protein [Kushneria phosphatilytica]OHV08741.1 hypothetical protein BH688_12015 [Kushneria phosphatilytica]
MSMHQPCLRLSLACFLALSLGGCGHHDDKPATSAHQITSQFLLKPVHLNRRIIQPDCHTHCATITVDSLRFDNAPGLTRQLEHRQLVLASDFNENADEAPASLQAFSDRFFAQAAQEHDHHPQTAPYEARFEAGIIADHDHLVVVRLDDYVFRGGAHGMPTTAYMVIDTRTQRTVTLNDMLVKGRRDAFDRVLKAAHQRWLKRLDQPLDPEDWPFTSSDNVALMEDDVVVKYQPYAIAPYAVGQPELHIPYSDLKGIFKPRYLPRDSH